jgi:hypothetical protein
MTNYYNLTEEQFDAVLRHEMVHVFQIQTNCRDKAHGKDFMREKARIEALGFKVSKGDTVDLALGYDGDQAPTAKKIPVLLLVPFTPTHGYGCFNLSAVREPLDIILLRAAVAWMSTVKAVYIVKTDHLAVQSAETKARKNSMVPKGIGISKESFDEIMATGEVIGGGNPSVILNEAKKADAQKPTDDELYQELTGAQA